MNHRSIISMFFLTLMTNLSLFGMIRRTAVAPKTVSSVAPQVMLPTSFSQLAHSYSSPSVPTFSPTVSTFPSYDTSQRSYWKSQSADAKNGWYKSKWLQYPLLISLGGLTGLAIGNAVTESPLFPRLIDMSREALLGAAFKISQDVAYEDPELYEVFLKIKSDYGITDDVGLRILIPLKDLEEKYPSFMSNLLKKMYYRSGAFYMSKFNTIFFEWDYKKRPKNVLIRVLAHELEHHRQYKQFAGSYYDRSFDLLHKKKEIVRIKEEIGADVAAADYLYCFKCLEETGKITCFDHEPQETEAGYHTSPLGYISRPDNALWVKRAKEDCALCLAHKSGTHKNPNTPMKDFLPPIVK